MHVFSFNHVLTDNSTVHASYMCISPQYSDRNKSCALRLNFSDAESSLGTSQLSSLMEDSVGGRASVLGHSQVNCTYQYTVHVCTTVFPLSGWDSFM